MSKPIQENYDTISHPYGIYLGRIDPPTDISINGVTGNIDRLKPVIPPPSVNGNVEVQPVKSSGGIGDVWIKNFIRSENWSPKNNGFYIDGQTGYAEFMNVYVSGKIEALSGSIGGFVIGSDYITDVSDSMGLASTVTAGDDVRFWAGASFANRNTAPFRVLESGKVYATYVEITGGVIDGGAIAPGTVGYAELMYPPLAGIIDPVTIPTALGQIYINTVLDRIFMSVGIVSYLDWVLIGTTVLPRSIPGGIDNVRITEYVRVAIVGFTSLGSNLNITEEITMLIPMLPNPNIQNVGLTEHVSVSMLDDQIVAGDDISMTDGIMSPADIEVIGP